MKLWFEKGAWASKKAKNIARDISPESVRSIAIIRHASIGDMMVLRPFLVQARAFFPNATITLSIIDTYSYGAPLDLVDRVHTVHKKREGKKTSFLSRYKQIRELGNHDLLFDMTDSGLSGVICFLNKAKVKIGFPYRRVKNFLFFDISLLRSDLVPEVETLLHMLYIFGAPKHLEIDYGYKNADKKESRIVYFMGASVPSKQWPKGNFSSLIQKMAHQYPGYEHIVLEGIGINEKVDDVMTDFSQYANVKKLEALPLDNMMEYLAHSQAVVCNDTRIRNMAIASNTATVGIFFSTVPYRYLPYTALHTAVFEPDGSMPSVERVFESLKTSMSSF
ncbi:MAG: glycosyltransferase family 9 protein [Sulfuricurvum sp.]|uniref:glycosyltransferase family 9 protein n=1 Tax=Sulfuricurvum sp. TaxID=2025608 RepID=UPI00260DC013|nr:glycosyltransferase family 9 protein [Sulfuricurvum sp.]MDD5117485.1 glycosyltransferase family 9 protein [Sulfuricurvum sp.]